MDKRFVEWDILRGVGIILVIIGHLRHIIPDDSTINLFIYSFHMPLFIIASGFLFANKSANSSNNVLSKHYIQKKYASLIVPYFVFSLWSLVYCLPNSHYSAKEMLVGILAGGGGVASRVENVALWFLPMIFVASIIFSGIHTISAYISKNKSLRRYLQAVLVVITSAIGCMLLKYHNEYVFWSIDVALCVQIFLYFGYILYHILKKTKTKNTIYNVVVMVICFFVWVFTAKFNGRIDLNGRQINNPFIYYIAGISGTLFFYLLSKYLFKFIPGVSSILSWCGKYSLLIMGMHLPLAMIIYGGLSEYLPFGQYVWNSGIQGVCYILFYVIVFTALLKNVLPFGSQK